MKKLRKILLIDDDESTSSLNKEMLEEMQVVEQVLTFTNQWDALQYIVEVLGRKEVPGESAFDLVILYINMPDLNSLDFLLDLEAFCIDIEKLPVVIVSGYLDMGSSIKLQDFGNRITAYLSQPLHKKAVEEVLKNLTFEKG